LPQLWYRNTWSWTTDTPRSRLLGAGDEDGAIDALDPYLGSYRFRADAGAPELFTENETNVVRLYGVHAPGPFKDAFHEFVVKGNRDALSPTPDGSKAAFHYKFTIPPGGSAKVRVRLSLRALEDALGDFDLLMEKRRREADEFYRDVQTGIDDPDIRLVQRQAFAGLIWSKQFYCYEVPVWLKGDPTQPAPPATRLKGRNNDWPHLNNNDIISMPDKWEYPWYASWDLAFHCISLALIDPEFAKGQILLMTREWYMHPNGQLPAYEWNFSDVNPPVHAWSAWRVFELERRQRGGTGDLDFLKRVFHKLLLNFTWWVNRKDVAGRNLFQGGFLGLDNIGVFDRSAPLPTGGYLDQADGTAWMAMFSLNMLRISLELAQQDHSYEDLATKFFEHFLYIAEAMTNMGGEGIGLWDEEDEFYYSVLNLPDGRFEFMKSRSMEGLIPMFAVEVLDPELLERCPWFTSHMSWFMNHRPDLAALISRWQVQGKGQRHLLSLLRGHRMKKLLQRMLDETEFLSDHGVRALSKYHKGHPYVFDCDTTGSKLSVEYWPAESRSGMFGGNSNWRGPIWMPVNYLLYESLRRFHLYYGDDFKVECPTGSGTYMTLNDVALELCRRLGRLFLRGPDGRRPVFGDSDKFQEDPHFRDYVLFYEYFDGDTGRGLGASHQTGWTGLIAALLRPHEDY
jgi:hypothetical protein